MNKAEIAKSLMNTSLITAALFKQNDLGEVEIDSAADFLELTGYAVRPQVYQ